MDSLDQVRKGLADKSAVLVDVRELDEWKDGHLRDASLLPLSEIPVLIEGNTLDKRLPKDKVIYCHCRSGGRVLKAAVLLAPQGYDIRPLKQGYRDLLKEGFPKASADN